MNHTGGMHKFNCEIKLDWWCSFKWRQFHMKDLLHFCAILCFFILFYLFFFCDDIVYYRECIIYIVELDEGWDILWIIVNNWICNFFVCFLFFVVLIYFYFYIQQSWTVELFIPVNLKYFTDLCVV